LSRNPSFRRGVREGIPFALAGGLLSLSFGVLARDTGLGAWGAILMSAVVFGGSAQFASVGIMVAGGGLGSALLAATLVNSRFLPMGVALAPYLPGGTVKRALQGQPIVDPSWVLARDTGGHFDRHVLFGATAIQYVTWVGGTAVGALVGTGGVDPATLGLDSLFPAFFLLLLIEELRHPGARGVALAGALIALALVPFTPAGVPVIVASLAALAGLGRDPAELSSEWEAA
jgi:4-azaleucine resistance transporter AzlC